jgi:hypothetical protein
VSTSTAKPQWRELNSLSLPAEHSCFLSFMLSSSSEDQQYGHGAAMENKVGKILKVVLVQVKVTI